MLQCDSSGNTGTGIQVSNRGVVTGCVANGNASGVTVGTNCTLRDYTACNNAGTGITVGTTGTVYGCTTSTNNGTSANDITGGNNCSEHGCRGHHRQHLSLGQFLHQ